MSTLPTFLQQLNEAFARNDTKFILDHVTEDIRWHMLGDQLIEGKEAMAKFLESMKAEQPMALNIAQIIVQGSEAAVHGSMDMPDASGRIKTYAFCDLYQMQEAEDHKVKIMTSFVIEIKTE